MIWKITILDYLSMGGWVMIPLIALSFLLMILVTERLLYLRRLQQDSINTDEMIDLLDNGKNQSDVDLKNAGLHGQLLDRFLTAKATYGKLNEMVVQEVTNGFSADLKINLRLIGGLTGAAPLLGLLGTVSGMITTFNVLTIFGTGNAKAMSGGISEALITTQFGLVIAILGLFANSVIQRWARGCEQVMREVAHHITRKFEE